MSGAAWEALDRELDVWAAAGRVATFWWRDDDAADATAPLRRLFGLAAREKVPLMLAVTPATATPALAAALAGLPGAVLQHGYAHLNHAPPGAPKSELSGARPLARRIADLEAGWVRLGSMFGAQLLPVLVPPWNRIDDDLVDALAAQGYKALSTYRPRDRVFVRPGLRQVNTHLDLIDWAGTRRFVGLAAGVAAITGHLAAKRTAWTLRPAPEEPTGVLSHHLAMDEPSWDFLASLLRRTQPHPGAGWLDAAEIFP